MGSHYWRLVQCSLVIVPFGKNLCWYEVMPLIGSFGSHLHIHMLFPKAQQLSHGDWIWDVSILAIDRFSAEGKRPELEGLAELLPWTMPPEAELILQTDSYHGLTVDQILDSRGPLSFASSAPSFRCTRARHHISSVAHILELAACSAWTPDEFCYQQASDLGPSLGFLSVEWWVGLVCVCVGGWVFLESKHVCISFFPSFVRSVNMDSYSYC